MRRGLAKLGRADEALADRIADAFTKMRRDEYKLYPDAHATVDALRRFKEDATEVREGFECGIGVGYNDIHIADVIETFEMREKPRA